MSLHLGMKEPKDLPQALHLCLKMENQFVRTQFANSHNHPKPSNNKQNNRSNYSNYQQEFIPQLAHMPQPYSHQRPFYVSAPIYHKNNSNQMRPQGYINPNVPPPRPTEPKPQPRPEPMDIDQSVRTRAINYMNRPAQNDRFFGKRPNVQQSEQRRLPPKIQRNFHIETQQNEDLDGQYYE